MESSIYLPVSVLRSVLIYRVKFYPDLSLEISIDLPALRSILVNPSKVLSISVFGNFHRLTSVKVSFNKNSKGLFSDPSLEISIDLPVTRNIIVSE